MDGWRRYLFIALFPLNLCGLFLTIAAGHLPPQARVSSGAALAAGLLLIAPSAILMVLTLPWSETLPDDEEDDDGEPLEAGDAP